MPTMKGTINIPVWAEIWLFILLCGICIWLVIKFFAWIDDEFAKILTELDEYKKIETEWDRPPVHINCRSTLKPRPVKVIKEFQLHSVSMVDNPERGYEIGMQGLATLEDQKPLPHIQVSPIFETRPLTDEANARKIGKGFLHVNNDASYVHPANVSYIGKVPELDFSDPGPIIPRNLREDENFKQEFRIFWLGMVETFPRLLQFASAEALAQDAFYTGWMLGEANAEGPF